MRKQRFSMILPFLMGLLIIGACEKFENPALEEEQSLEAFEDDAALKAAGIGFAIVVEPEGPENDTENLRNAFQEAAERPGRVLIQLTQGTYYLDYMVIQDFEGWFRGAGKDKTVIHPVPGGIDIPVTTPFLETEPFFINFRGGDIQISDMSFDINLDEPVEPYDWWSGDQVTFMTAVIRISGSTPENYTANSLIRNISVKGRRVDLHDFTPYNVDNAIVIGGGYGTLPLGGNHLVQNCDFLSAETGINSLGASYSKLVFGGSPALGNSMKNLNTGIFILGSEASDFQISFNRMEDMHAYGGIEIVQESTTPPFAYLNPGGSKFMIHKNSIELAPDPYSNAIALWDYLEQSDPDKKSDFKVIGNTASLCMPWQGFLASYAPNDVMAVRNKISGEAMTGIWVYGPSHGFQLVNNDFTNFNSIDADIFLSVYSHDNMVMAGHQTTVLDQGTNNTMRGNVELVSPALKSAGLDSPKVKSMKERALIK